MRLPAAMLARSGPLPARGGAPACRGSGEVRAADIVSWIEHSNPSVYRREVLHVVHVAAVLRRLP